jgi:hypothetical protein
MATAFIGDLFASWLKLVPNLLLLSNPSSLWQSKFSSKGTIVSPAVGSFGTSSWCPDYSSYSQVSSCQSVWESMQELVSCARCLTGDPQRVPWRFLTCDLIQRVAHSQVLLSRYENYAIYFDRAAAHLCIQTVILDMKARLKDPDLARLFENTFPNTLGTYRNSLFPHTND